MKRAPRLYVEGSLAGGEIALDGAVAHRLRNVLRLGPGEEITVNIEADLTMVGLVLNVQPLDAHLVNVAVVSNPSAATGGVSAGFLGSVTGCPPIQFTGVDVTAEWLTESRALIRSAGNVDAVTRLALLVHAAADPKRLPEAARADTKAIWTDVVEAWKALPERAQAWVIGVMPEDTPEMAPLLEAAKASTSPTVMRSAGWAKSYPPPAPRWLTTKPPFFKVRKTCSINLAGVPEALARAAACRIRPCPPSRAKTTSALTAYSVVRFAAMGGS